MCKIKFAYTISGLFNSGGMERVLTQKANYLADVLGYDVTVITTDQNNRAPFFKLSDNVRHIDLGINYFASKKSRFWHLKKLSLKRLHKKRLQKVLQEEKFDVVDSLMDFDFGFLYKIKDKSKKVIEFHFSKYGKAIASRNAMFKKIQKIRADRWNKLVSRYDKFVVLTHEDASQWAGVRNIEVIPNFLDSITENTSPLKERKVVSIGRFDYQKGFDMLVEAWRVVHNKFPDWNLEIIGGGDHNDVQKMIAGYNLNGSVLVSAPTKDVASKYMASSIYVLSSRYEGLPMVLLEAMSYGLPVVAFECPCGPKDVIDSSFGVLCPNGDILSMANGICDIIGKFEGGVLNEMGRSARNSVQRFEKNRIMEVWDKMYRKLIE